jgi:hypothetical protein
MKTKTLGLLLGSFVAGSTSQFAVALEKADLVLTGPVESVDATDGSVSVFGHRIAVRDAASYVPGTLVSVYGKLRPSGGIAPIATRVLALSSSGADPLLIKGVVTRVSTSTGHLDVGSTDVDYTPLLADSEFSIPAVGDVVEIDGTQPSSRGVFIATRVSPIDSTAASVASVTGSGKALGVTGSGKAEGVTGSGKAEGVTGSGKALGVTGSGKAEGVTGSGKAE